MTTTLREHLRDQPLGYVLNVLSARARNLAEGNDETVAALGRVANVVGARLVLAGGAAVIWHGYESTTDDRVFLIDDPDLNRLEQRLTGDALWERLVSLRCAYVYRPTRVRVDFLVTGHAIAPEKSYLCPKLDELEIAGVVEGVSVVGLHDLMWLKLVAGRMRDLVDVMELCKLHLALVDPDRVLRRPHCEDEGQRNKLAEIWHKAPIELANEARLGQGANHQLKVQN